VKIISYGINRGKGYAVKQGIIHSTGENILICDADLSTPISELDKLLKYSGDYNLIIGSRKQRDAKVIKPQPFIRRNLGRAFSFLSKIILNVEATDFTCGFKLIKKEAAKKIASKMLIHRWVYDSELLKIAAIHNFKIKEVGILWRNDGRSKVRLMNDIPTSLFDLVNIVYNSYMKKYD
jgi:dolichyl-phosphate beta-glucosyltransferase